MPEYSPIFLIICLIVKSLAFKLSSELLLISLTTSLEVTDPKSAPCSLASLNITTVLGTLEITNDEFRPYNADKVYIHNVVIGDGTGSANSAKFDMSEADTFNGTVFVDNVTINSDGQLLFGDGDETSATEGSSALNVTGAFRNLGGSVDIE